MSDTNRPMQLQKRARSLKFQIKEEELYYPSSKKTKALISFAVTAKLIYAFVFAYAKIHFSHDATHMTYSHVYAYFINAYFRGFLNNKKDVSSKLFLFLFKS